MEEEVVVNDMDILICNIALMTQALFLQLSIKTQGEVRTLLPHAHAQGVKVLLLMLSWTQKETYLEK